MKLKEVRVGSIVTHPIFGIPVSVKAIAFNGLHIGTEDGVPIHIDEFKPVEITDEILEKLHFVKMTDTATGIGEYDWWENENISLIHLYKGLYGIQGLNGIKPIRYVHQLQNACLVIDDDEDLNTDNLLSNQ